jgi:hypothetical protein
MSKLTTIPAVAMAEMVPERNTRWVWEEQARGYWFSFPRES